MRALGVVLASCLAGARSQAREIRLQRVQDKIDARGDDRKGQWMRQGTHSRAETRHRDTEDRHRDTPLAVFDQGLTICPVYEGAHTRARMCEP
jgi:hypothetical protein